MKNKNILIVEDDNIIAMEIQSRLEEQGYGVLGPYAYGEDVVENIGNLDVDLILMDINLKGSLDGIQTAQIIKAKHRKPIIYLTAYADQKTLDRAKITEPFGYIIKPFEERELFTNIEMALYKHQIELKLIESEQWLQTTLKSIGDGVIATDIQTNIKFMNEVAESLTGWSFEEANGRKLEDVFKIISETNRTPCINPVDRVISEGIVVGLANHTLLINKNGNEIPIADTASPIKDEFGNVTGCVLVFQDHTERRKYQVTLEESEKKYRTTLESMDDGIYVVDKNLNIVLMNSTLKSWVKDLGYSDYDEHEGKKINDFKPFVRDGVINDIKRTFQTCQPIINEVDYSTNGTKFFTETKMTPIFSNDNDSRLVTVIRNITEKKLNIDELNKSKSQLQSILDFTPAIVYIKDLSGKFQLVNKKFEHVLSSKNEDICGKKEFDIFDSVTAEILSRNDEVLKEEGTVTNYEEMLLHDDNNFHTYIFSKFLLFDSYGNQTSICTIATDITERKQAEEEISNLNINLEKRVLERTEQVNKINQELKIENEKRKSIHIELSNKQKLLSASLEKEQELNNMKNDFIAMISHEYRTPLTVIQSSANIIDILVKKGEHLDIEMYLDRIDQSIKRMTGLLDETLALNRLNSSKSTPKPEDFNLISTISTIIEISQASEKEYHQYEFLHQEDQLIVNQDQSSLCHILGNLISNSAKYSEINTKISIILEDLDENKFLIKIKDQGIGIPQNDLKNIFDSFFRGSNVKTIPGTGLGLSIVQKNVVLIGGEISIESVVGTGTTITLIIPKFVTYI